MFKKFISALALLILCATTINAQDGVFIEAGAGVYFHSTPSGFGSVRPSTKVDLGYKFLPQLAGRIDFQLGLSNSTPATDTWFVGGHLIQVGIAADLLWDVLPTFSKKDYLYHLQPYIRIQETFGSKRNSSTASFGAGGGIRQMIGFRSVEQLFLVIDANAVATNAKKWSGEDGPMMLGQATFGFAWMF